MILSLSNLDKSTVGYSLIAITILVVIEIGVVKAIRALPKSVHKEYHKETVRETFYRESLCREPATAIKPLIREATIEVIESVDDSLPILMFGGVLSDDDLLAAKINTFESDMNATAISRSGNHFGLCQLNDYWGTRLAREGAFTWLKDKTDEEAQAQMCEARFALIKKQLEKNSHVPSDLLIYLLHQQGIKGGLRILDYVSGVETTIPNDHRRRLMNNLPKALRIKYAEHTSKDTEIILYEWVRYSDRQLRKVKNVKTM